MPPRPGEFSEAATLIARHWLGTGAAGGLATVARWLDELPDEAITANPPVAYVAAWIRGFCGASKQETERWLAATEDDAWEGVLPDGIKSLAFGAALTRAAQLFGDVGRSAGAARRAVDLAGPEPRRCPGWRRRRSARPCTCPDTRRRLGLGWRSWSGSCRHPQNRSP